MTQGISQTQYPRLLHVLPVYLIIVSFFIILIHLFPPRTSRLPSPPPSPNSTLVRITLSGGLCPPSQSCTSSFLLSNTGVLTTPTGDKQLDTNLITRLHNLIETSDFPVLRARKFTGICPTAYDGQKTVYLFFTSHGPQTLDSCETAIDNSSSLFQILAFLTTDYQYLNPIYPTPTPTIAVPAPTWETSSDISNWVYFNPSYTAIPERDFRFKYPRIFTAENVDSGNVGLKINGRTGIFIDQFSSSVQSAGQTSEDNFLNLYAFKNNNKPKPNFQKIVLSSGEAFVVTEVGESACGNNFIASDFTSDPWKCFWGNINGHGFILGQLNFVPDDIALAILQSIQFK